MNALVRQLPGPQLVMLYLVFGNEDARVEIMMRVQQERQFNETVQGIKARKEADKNLPPGPPSPPKIPWKVHG